MITRFYKQDWCMKWSCKAWKLELKVVLNLVLVRKSKGRYQTNAQSWHQIIRTPDDTVTTATVYLLEIHLILKGQSPRLITSIFLSLKKDYRVLRSKIFQTVAWKYVRTNFELAQLHFGKFKVSLDFLWQLFNLY